MGITVLIVNTYLLVKRILILFYLPEYFVVYCIFKNVYLRFTLLFILYFISGCQSILLHSLYLKSHVLTVDTFIYSLFYFSLPEYFVVPSNLLNADLSHVASQFQDNRIPVSF